MSLSPMERNTVITLQLEKTDRFLQQADDMAERQCWDMAANRYYYACFHAVQALFIANQLSCKTHRGLIGMFNLHFVKSGLVSMEIGSFLARMEQLREQADYNCNYNVSEREISEIAPNAKAIVGRIKELIGRDESKIVVAEPRIHQ